MPASNQMTGFFSLSRKGNRNDKTKDNFTKEAIGSSAVASYLPLITSALHADDDAGSICGYLKRLAFKKLNILQLRRLRPCP